MTTAIKIGLLVLGAIALGFWWFSGTHVRYILTVELEVEGQKRTASSVIGVDYYPRQMFRLGPGTGGPAHVRGISPMFDLGERGTLFAALQVDTEDFVRLYGTGPATAIGWPIRAYNLDVHSVGQAQGRGPVELRRELYPGFIWMPATQNWRDARQMKHDDVPNIVSAAVHVTKVTLTPSYRSEIKTKIEPTPEWLVDLRERANRGETNRPGRFNFSNIFIESHNTYDPYRGLKR